MKNKEVWQLELVTATEGLLPLKGYMFCKHILCRDSRSLSVQLKGPQFFLAYNVRHRLSYDENNVFHMNIIFVMSVIMLCL